jgi:hypothetical protein
MTDVRRSGRRGIPLSAEANILELIVAGRDDLCDSDGKPVLARIAKAAGIHKQRLSPLGFDSFTLGALVRYHAVSHNISDKEAIAALLRIGEPEAVAA